MSLFTDKYGLKEGWVLTFCVLGTVAVIGLVVFFFAYAYPTWWEDHKTERGRGDAPVARIAQEGDGEHDEVWAIEMPDDFSNFATRCVWDGYRGFSTTGDGGAFVIEDPGCDMPNFVPASEVEE